MNLTLHPIAEVCELTAMHRLSANPEQWITRQITAGRFRARRIGRQWAMTDADIQYMLDQLANNAAEPAEPERSQSISVPSLASRRRRRVSA